MDIQTKKLRNNCWVMHLVEPHSDSKPYSGNFNIKAVQQIVLEVAEEVGAHDGRVRLINDELVASDFTMWSRQAFDTWHWYDKDEMNHFLTYFNLKHGEK